MKEQTARIQGNVATMVMTALMAAVLCVVGPLAIPIGPVPISLQMLVLFISIYILGTRMATVSCVLYLVMGLVGLPVFSNHEGGLGKLAGPTGGYLIGFIPMVIIAGLIIHMSYSIGKSRIVTGGIQLGGMVLATIVLYAFGTTWFVLSTDTSVVAALGMCVIPFIPGDIIKIVVSMILGPSIALLVKKAGETVAK